MDFTDVNLIFFSLKILKRISIWTIAMWLKSSLLNHFRQYIRRYIHFSTSTFKCYCIIINYHRPKLGKLKKGVAHEVPHRKFLGSFNIHGWFHRRAGIQFGLYELIEFWLISEVTIQYVSDRLCVFVVAIQYLRLVINNMY